ncbi:hypothetical protein [Candidatus Nitrosocosmicus franklandus]|nr:hypothetical protein [Candidatus Nitrosocosmicus franklandus]
MNSNGSSKKTRYAKDTESMPRWIPEVAPCSIVLARYPKNNKYRQSA